MSQEGYILFCIGKTWYALPASQVQQVSLIEQVTPVPNAPDFVDGVVYLRGQVVPVINLRQRFGLERVPYDLRARLIVVQMRGRVIGLAVDSAREFVNISSEDIFLPPEDLAAAGSEYLSGITLSQDRLVFILDVERMLLPAEQQVLETVSRKE